MTTAVKIPIADGTWWGALDKHLWADDGRTALPEASTLAEAKEHLHRFAAGEFFCAGCEEWHAKPHAFRRFAGLYCEEAAERYKKANSRTCGLCRRPIWDCYC